MVKVLSIDDISDSQVETLLQRATQFAYDWTFRSGRVSLRKPRLALIFLEPSTRTRLSFQAAAQETGLILLQADRQELRLNGGESMRDTALMLKNYADIVVFRSDDDEDLNVLARWYDGAIINAGCGSKEHPTQALIDFLALKTYLPSLEGLLVCGGAPEKMRALNSFTKLVRRMAPTLTISFDWSQTEDADIIYMNSKARPRPGIVEPNPCTLGTHLKLKPSCKILHPLARHSELPVWWDITSHNGYFSQAALAVPVRLAVLEWICAAL